MFFFSDLGFMNPDGQKSGLISILSILQWVHAIVAVVAKGNSDLLNNIRKVSYRLWFIWHTFSRRFPPNDVKGRKKQVMIRWGITRT